MTTELTALVIIDVGPEVRAVGTRRIRAFGIDTLEFDSIDDYIQHAVTFNPRRDPAIFRRSLRNNLRTTPLGKLTWKWDPRPRIHPPDDAAVEARRARLWEDVARIGCPTLVVRGGESDVFSAADAAKLVDRLPDGRLAVVERSGHTVQGDNPAGLMRELRSFFREIGF